MQDRSFVNTPALPVIVPGISNCNLFAVMSLCLNKTISNTLSHACSSRESGMRSSSGHIIKDADVERASVSLFQSLHIDIKHVDVKRSAASSMGE